MITEGKLFIKLDDENALDESNDQIHGDWPLHTSQKCYDFFFLEIKNRIKKIPIDIKIGWVKGYQSGQRDWWGKIKINVFTLFLC